MIFFCSSLKYVLIPTHCIHSCSIDEPVKRTVWIQTDQQQSCIMYVCASIPFTDDRVVRDAQSEYFIIVLLTTDGRFVLRFKPRISKKLHFYYPSGCVYTQVNMYNIRGGEKCLQDTVIARWTQKIKYILSSRVRSSARSVQQYSYIVQYYYQLCADQNVKTGFRLLFGWVRVSLCGLRSTIDTHRSLQNFFCENFSNSNRNV